MFQRNRKVLAIIYSLLAVIGLGFTIIADTAVANPASPTGGDALPWEGAIAKLQASITGPVALSISLIAIVAAGGALVFGGDMQGFMRTAAYLALVLGIIIAASNVLSSLYGTSINLPSNMGI